MYVDNITSKGVTLNSAGKSMQIEVYEKELKRLNNVINELEKLIEQYSRNDYYYKYNGKYLKSEIIDDLKKLKEKK